MTWREKKKKIKRRILAHLIFLIPNHPVQFINCFMTGTSAQIEEFQDYYIYKSSNCIRHKLPGLLILSKAVLTRKVNQKDLTTIILNTC